MGTLYPGLMRLEQKGLIRAKWQTTEHNRRARYYSITASGRRRLDEEKAGWDRTAEIIRRLFEGV
jgi:PadR family transcriptional regulator PadR